MYRKGKRWLLFLLMTVLPLTGPLITSLSKLKTPSNPLIQPWWPYPLYVLFALISASLAYLSIIQPVRKFEPVAKKFLDVLGDKILSFGREKGIQPRVNILLVYREPSWLFLRKYFHIVWGLGMENQPDVRVSFHVSKGVAGETLESGRPRLVDMEELPHENWGFTEHEAQRFQHLTAIYSWPIYEVDHNGEQTGRRIGCVNLDAMAAGSRVVIEKHLRRFDGMLREFAEIA